ncbi:hypothetical protein AN191_06850 [Loktanella sp. 5RATIMAR09]|uniref:hypothetical protein n=1 Tax=Loktanella sp. 5RATIMAR09 TaxID=1225655 RepID=UPI0006EBA68E|nr:hypothetical protein [Loktanella sp. 5RATIMAR09]KQI72721.1 hypothetical protein AN191_06850 [Loktanella sp. 5RATIMAR09]
MTNIDITAGGIVNHVARATPFATEDQYWGYKVLSREGAPVSVMIGQAISFFLGVCLVTATFGVLVLPTLFFDGNFGFMRIGAAVLMGAVGFYLLWFASRGSIADVHIDTKAREIREVVANRFGSPTTVGLYTFDEISGIFLELDETSGQSQLLLGYNDSANAIRVAKGAEAQLLPLRDRLAKDLL